MRYLVFKVARDRNWKVIGFDVDTGTVVYICRCQKKNTRKLKHFVHQECRKCNSSGVIYTIIQNNKCPLCTGPCPVDVVGMPYSSC